jgi:uncharacterized membrane protein
LTVNANDAGRMRFPKIYAKWVLWIILIISLIWNVSMVLAPMTIPPGTVSGLYGGANRLDYGDLWSTLPPAQGAVYMLGDIECHQIASRTIYVNGNQMPVCARDASLFLFLSFGFLAAAVVKPDIAISRMVLRLLPAGMRGRLEKGIRPLLFTWFLSFLCLAPIAIDGGLQLVTSYESTNALRFITGAPAGFFLGLILGMMIQSLQLPTAPRRATFPEVPPPSC